MRNLTLYINSEMFAVKQNMNPPKGQAGPEFHGKDEP